MEWKYRIHNRFVLLTVVSFAVVFIFTTNASAFLSPRQGRFLQRDLGSPPKNSKPTSANLFTFDLMALKNQYADGMSLYQYVGSNPVDRVDPPGLWGRDVHHDLTFELAKKAGIACASDVAAGGNRPDEDERDAPTSFKRAAALRLAASLAAQQGDFFTANRLYKEADRLMRQAAEWHFPADKDGIVSPNSAAANAKVNKGIKDCDFKLFSEGLHTLQDSFSHQGKPYMEGLGHGRGAEWVPGHWEHYGFLWHKKRWVPGYWKKLTGFSAALSHSADDVTIWPEDARAAGIATYQKMLEFKKACPCACPSPNTKTSSGSADKDINPWLNRKYPGNNKVK